MRSMPALLLVALLAVGGRATSRAGDVPHSLFVVPAQINGLAAGVPFVLDSGAEHTILDLATAKQLGLRIRYAGNVGGARSRVALGHIDHARVAALGTVLNAPDLLVLDLGATPGAPRGLLGFEWFAAHAIRLDGPRHAAEILGRPRAQAEERHARAFPLFVSNRELYVEIAVTEAGRTVVRQARIDTGSTDALVDASALQAPDRRKVVLGKTVRRDLVGYVATVDRVAIGPFAFHRVHVRSGPTRIGMGLLKHFVAIVDVPAHRLYLTQTRP